MCGIVGYIGNQNAPLIALYIPKVDNLLAPVLTVIPMQLLAYYTSVLKGKDVDKPRNLAKSVTVE